VDDDAFLRDMYAAKFSEAGDTVEVVVNGQDALEVLDNKEFDMVVMDMIMPGMTGVELIKAIHKIEKNRGVKCIVLSNQGEDHEIESATKAGAVGYLIKAELIPSEVVTKIHEFAQT